jgi:hypothetical protein
MGGTVSEPDWKRELRKQLDGLSGSHPDLAPGGSLRAVIVSLVEVHRSEAYQRGLMAGRSQTGYRTTRKKKTDQKEERWRTTTAGAAGPTPASTTETGGEP